MNAFKTILKKTFWCFSGFNQYNWSYKLVALLGVIIRVGFLPLMVPNIFDVVAEYFVSQLHLPQWAYEIIIRIILYIFECLGVYHIFYWVSFATVGSSYKRGTIPPWGSLCYTLYYIAYMAVPILIFQFFYWWVICVTFLGYIVLCALIYFLSGLIGTLPESWKITIVIHSVFIAIIFTGVCLIKGLIF